MSFENYSSLFSNLTAIQDLPIRKTKEISGSKFSIGFETLDRKMFEDEKCYDHLVDLGVKRARIQTGWSRSEQEKGVIDFEWLDRIVDKLLSIGIQPWLNVGYGNINHVPQTPTPDAVAWPPLWDKGATEAWSNFVKKVATHFKGRVEYFEVWNEPDLEVFWQPKKPAPEDYTQLVINTSTAIKSVYPEAKIVGGATARGIKPAGNIFLAKCIKLGMLDHIDVYSYHFYGMSIENNGSNLPFLTSLLSKGKKHIPIWQGESGCPSVFSETQALSGIKHTEESQAKWLLRNMINDLSKDIDMVSYFHMSDFKFYYRDGFIDVPNYFGILRLKDYSRKPSFFALQSLCSLFDLESTTFHEGQLTVRNLIYDDDTVSNSNETNKSFVYHSFIKNDVPIYSYYYNSIVTESRKTSFGDIKIWVTDGRLPKNPILIDPVEQKVYDLKSKIMPIKLKADDGAGHWDNPEYVWDSYVEFEGIPLVDYPLFITDQSYFDQK